METASPEFWEERLIRLWHGHIPLAAAMQVSIARIDANALELTAPLDPNANHMGTAFGGALQALATLAGWGASMIAAGALPTGAGRDSISKSPLETRAGPRNPGRMPGSRDASSRWGSGPRLPSNRDPARRAGVRNQCRRREGGGAGDSAAENSCSRSTGSRG